MRRGYPATDPTNIVIDHMGNDLRNFIDKLAGQYSGVGPVIRPPYLYLDPQAVLYLYQELTGRRDAPWLVPAGQAADSGEAALAKAVETGPCHGESYQVPLYKLYEAMGDLIEAAIPEVAELSGLVKDGQRLIRVRGRLQGTHFPDGNLNLEIAFAGVRGLVFYTEEYFNTLARPLLNNDRFFAMDETVEALIYLLGPLQKIIFYHQAYGDNREHDWIPLAPLVIRPIRAGQEDVGRQP